jgi:hypothetical protein
VSALHEVRRQSEAAQKALKQFAGHVREAYFRALLLASAGLLREHLEVLELCARDSGQIEHSRLSKPERSSGANVTALAEVCKFRLDMLSEVLVEALREPRLKVMRDAVTQHLTDLHDIQVMLAHIIDAAGDDTRKVPLTIDPRTRSLCVHSWSGVLQQRSVHAMKA